mmetsp:Transcript_1091/g.2729  ORF Transcript_1091/g.2729 Transcript_1091/m.2729 type:complete len:568 (+) Transcript_1091:68-1771(+)
MSAAKVEEAPTPAEVAPVPPSPVAPPNPVSLAVAPPQLKAGAATPPEVEESPCSPPKTTATVPAAARPTHAVPAAPAPVVSASAPPPGPSVKPASPPPPPQAKSNVPTPTKKPSGPVPSAVASASAPIAASSNKFGKSKKKKNQPTVTMATATTAQSGGTGSQGENTGRWTAEEHRLFLQGLEQHGKGWKKIASLIKSRTVVQIRTHAQKYFQKLAKARQNGEEGDVSMEGRGGPASVTSGGLTSTAPASKRRRQTTGTKRKAISSVVASAQREGKKLATAQTNAGVPCPVPPIPAVAPALAPFVVPSAQQPAPNATNATVPSGATSHGAISGPSLEDSLFRFLTPAPVASNSDTVQVNEVARQAGANPITLPSDNPSTAPSAAGGEVSPTGVTDVAIFPSWTDAKDMPSWYAKGADVDCLLDVADTLDWLTDTGDLHETYEPPAPAPKASSSPAPPPMSVPQQEPEQEASLTKQPSVTTMTADALTSDAPAETVVPPLPSLFENSSDATSKKPDKASSAQLSDTAEVSGDIDEHLNVFDTPMEEHAFVSALLENNGESSGSLPVLS